MNGTTKLRFRFTKLGKVRWTSHRDVARMWERAFRRTQLPLAYSEGFSPRPKVSFGLALPTGGESEAEYLDVEVAPGATIDVASLPARLSTALPTGIDVTAVAVLPAGTGSLQQEVTSCIWRLTVDGLPDEELERRVDAVLTAETVVVTRERKGQQVTDDLRPAIRWITRVGPGVLECELATQPRGVRPAELLLAIGPELELAGIQRISQWIERDGARIDPLGLPATTDAPHAEVRAS